MLKSSRKKKRNYKLTIIYRLAKLIFISRKKRLKLFSELEWIFERLALEESNKFYKNGLPSQKDSFDFIKPHLGTDSQICDFGCKYGQLSFMLSEICKNVQAIDLDQAAINYARKTYFRENLKFECIEGILFLSQNKEINDLIILSHVLEHIDEPQEFIRKISNYCLKIYIEVPDLEKSYLNTFRLDTGSSLIYSDTDHVFEFDRQSLKEMFDNLGLRILSSDFRFGVQRYLLLTPTRK